MMTAGGKNNHGVRSMPQRTALCLLLLVLLLVIAAGTTPARSTTCWPPPPDEARVEFVREIRLDELGREQGFLGRLLNLVGGRDPSADLALPFDVEIVGDHLFVVCRDLPALVRVDQKQGSYKMFRCSELPLSTPIALARAGGMVFVSDSGSGCVYRLEGERLTPWITEGLVRPTGIAAMPGGKTLCVVDTGDHQVKVFDPDGNRISGFGGRGEASQELNFPTFAAETDNGILVNDTLNYRIKRFDFDGVLISSFGGEGDGPGAFARPKGVALDPAGNTWVVDSLFDNIQVFDGSGRLLLVIGGPGQAEGEFWSPAGIATAGDEMYVADTYNNRIQVLHQLGGGS